jgi:hypothetical protein
MSNISPNSLFHFTPKLKYLINILKVGFEPRYFHETLILNDSKAFRGHDLGIPMICFCDISLGQIVKHVQLYGSYGIGMKKEWAVKNRLNPVIYLNKDSLIADPISNIMENAWKLPADKELESIRSELISSWQILQFFSKPYSGSFVHRGKLYTNKKFYDEREWRFIPISKTNNMVCGVLSKEHMLEKEKLLKSNDQLKGYSLHFTPDDVNYIFVAKESQIHSIVNDLRRMKNEDFNSETIDILTSKILTIENIKEDF